MLWDMGKDSRCESPERSDLLGVCTFTKSHKYTGKESSWCDFNTWTKTYVYALLDRKSVKTPKYRRDVLRALNPSQKAGSCVLL